MADSINIDLLNNKLGTLRSLEPMLNSLNNMTQDTAITLLTNVVRVLLSQVIELKSDYIQSVGQIKEADTRSAKVEQYSRRNTTTLVGLALDVSESENSIGNLAEKVSTQLTTVTGIEVNPSSFSAIHRNGQAKDKPDSGSANGAGITTRSKNNNKTVPPSITIRFKDSNLKDRVLSSYTNYNKAAKKPRSIKLYQSLSKFYVDLKHKVSKDLKEKYGDGSVRWIHWRSASAGLVCKLADTDNRKNKYIKNIHCYEDYQAELVKLK